MRSLIVFVKNPELGKVKTRLAKSIGDKAALKVYKYLLNYTSKVAEEVQCDSIYVYHSSSLNSKDNWQGERITNKLQVAGDLGEKMKSAFADVLGERGESVVLIGSDCIDINAEIINEAFEVLDQKDVVIGPAVDGGYYLLGMNEQHDSLFFNMPWSTDRLFQESEKEIEKRNLTFSLLKKISDIDVIEDLSNKINWKEL